MAISKTQPMRSAEIDIIDEVNALDNLTASHTASINALDNLTASHTTSINALDNLTASHTSLITELDDSLSDEISDREDGDTNIQNQIGEGFSSNLTIAQSLSETNGAISDIENEIGNGFDSQNTITAYANALDTFLGDRSQLDDTVVDAILALVDVTEILDSFSDRFKIDIIENITIPANDSVSTSHTFATPFLSTDSCILIAQVVTNELSSMFTYTLIDCTYSGFSYSIANSDADAHTVALGYVAIKVN